LLGGRVQSAIDYLQNLSGEKVMLPFQDTVDNNVAVAYNDALALGRDVVINGDFANWTADDPDNWTVTEVGDATSNVTENPAGECQIISDGTLAQIRQDVLVAGKSYDITIVVSARTSGTISVQVGSVEIADISNTGTFNYSPTADSPIFLIKRKGGVGCNMTLGSVSIKQTNIAASSAFSTPGDNPLDGANTNVSILQPSGLRGIPYAYEYVPASNPYTDWYSAELNSYFDPTSGSLGIFLQSDTWAAGTMYAVILGADANNKVEVYRDGTDIKCVMTAGGTAETITIASGSPTGWLYIETTWAVPGNFIAYKNGVVAGTEAIAGTWVGNLASTLCVVGASSTTPGDEWDGKLIVPDLFRRPKTQSEISKTSRLVGLS
jgi:hypothetical protein